MYTSKYFKTVLTRISVLCAMLAFSLPSSAIDLLDEDLHYVVTYKWGLINKDAATAVLSLRNDGPYYQAKLAASTLPWADKILMVRDTLISTMLRPSCLPVEYQKITHEGSRYGNDVVKFTISDGNVTGYATRLRSKNGGPVSKTDTVLHAKSPALDMLSVFYYLRSMDFSTKSPGSTVNVAILSGKNAEKLSVSYKGIETITFNNKTWTTYHLVFSFTMKGTVSSDAMDTWITVDESRIPVKLEGALPLGKVRAYYTGATPR
ncbi:MAG: DUF3108 domain-containing protein [Bacteroides sp.]|nr:DUF3108 domain-containing protein [Bacteroides sp.]